MGEEWRNSEAQAIPWGRWTRLNGTNAEILLPNDGGETPSGLVIRVRRAGSAAN